MDATNRWRRLEELFHAASQLEGAERTQYLSDECGSDEALRREVESLVEASESGHSFIERPAISLGLKLLSDGLAASLLGQSVGHYSVVRRLGRGGMGEVYLAEDSVLERSVALKFISDGGRAKDQLMKEARAVARLENPNICAVYGVEEIGDLNFIVMQYIEGETLAALLRSERLQLGRTLDLSEQIVSALAAAHDRGIIHRDVKPQNMIVTTEGQIKVLDFGLAKFVQQQHPNSEQAREALSHTAQVSSVVGTVAYMSPEQTRGEELDARSDIFSFGIVLCEMLSGVNPFLRETYDETLAAIRNEEAACEGLPAELSDSLTRIIRKCLAKEPALRYETAGQLLRELRGLRGGGRVERRAATPPPRRFDRTRTHLKYYAVAVLALVCLLLTGAGFVYVKSSRIHTLAILPITNKSQDPRADYLSEGLTRNLSDKFSYLPRLKVRALSVISLNTGEATEVAQIGRVLEADAVLTGQIINRSGSLQLHLSLLKTTDASQSWERTFDLGAVDLFVLQDQITREVTSNLGLWLIGDENRLLAKRQTNSEEALNLYMRGRRYWSLKRDRENIQAAIELFDRAIELDPAFAKAYTGLADSYVLMSNVAYGPMRTKEAMDKARWAARQALEIDESLPEAHTSMGVIKFRYDWEWEQSEQLFRRAIVLDPEYAPAHYWYSNLLAVSGRFEEALRESETAKALDPYSPVSAMNYGRMLYYARRYDEAAEYFRKLLGERPDYPQFQHLMGLILLQQGRYPEAIAVLEKMHEPNPRFAAAALGFAYGKAGRLVEAAGILRELDEFNRKEPMPSLEKALVYIGTGDKDAAFAQLEDAYKERFASLAYLRIDPLYDDLRSEPRFADLIRRVNVKP